MTVPSTAGTDDDDEDEVYEVADRVGLDTSDIYNLDVNSDKFKTLPQGHQYDILRYIYRGFHFE